MEFRCSLKVISMMAVGWLIRKKVLADTFLLKLVRFWREHFKMMSLSKGSGLLMIIYTLMGFLISLSPMDKEVGLIKMVLKRIFSILKRN